MKILLLGKDGQVGWELQRALAPLGELVAHGRDRANLEDIPSVVALIRAERPDVIVNAAAYTAVDKAESDTDRADLINHRAVAAIAAEAHTLGAWFVHYSTDYVFAGDKAAPYVESDPIAPQSVYGTTKQLGEAAIAASGCKHLIFRTSWVFAARGGNFAKTMLRLAADREELRVVGDQTGAPTSAELIADATALCIYRTQVQPDDAYSGIYHLVAGGETTWHGYAQYVIGLAAAKGAALKAKPEQVHPIATTDYPVPAKRPANSRLDTQKIQRTFALSLPDWKVHVARLIDEIVI